MFSVNTSAEPRCSGPLLAYVSFGWCWELNSCHGALGKMKLPSGSLLILAFYSGLCLASRLGCLLSPSAVVFCGFGPPPSTNFNCVWLCPPSIFYHIIVFSLVFVFVWGFIMIDLWPLSCMLRFYSAILIQPLSESCLCSNENIA